jgi:hypothetical protein
VDGVFDVNLPAGPRRAGGQDEKDRSDQKENLRKFWHHISILSQYLFTPKTSYNFMKGIQGRKAIRQRPRRCACQDENYQNEQLFHSPPP